MHTSLVDLKVSYANLDSKSAANGKGAKQVEEMGDFVLHDDQVAKILLIVSTNCPQGVEKEEYASLRLWGLHKTRSEIQLALDSKP